MADAMVPYHLCAFQNAQVFWHFHYNPSLPLSNFALLLPLLSRIDSASWVYNFLILTYNILKVLIGQLIQKIILQDSMP